jgi:PAS domain S-box-containing protein
MSPVGISRVNILGQVIYGNPRWMEMSGRGADEELSKESLVDLVHPDDRGIMEELLKDAIGNMKKVAFELRWGTLDRFLWIMGELVPEIVDEEVQYDDSSMLTKHRGFIGVLTDVTQRRHSEQARLEAVEEARAQQELAIGSALILQLICRHNLPRITKSAERYIS